MKTYEEITARAEGGSAEKKGMRNVYVCQSCKRKWVCELKDSGTTPFMIGCRKCDGDCHSSFYNITATEAVLVVDFYWYRPTKQQLKRICRKLPSLRDSLVDHWENGGLFQLGNERA